MPRPSLIGSKMLPFYAGWILLGIALAGAACTAAAALLAKRRFSAGRPESLVQPPVTVLRPLSGAGPELLETLASSLRQDYFGQVQLVCGIQADDDPAKAVIARLRSDFPDREIVLVAGSRREGRNPKISNLINMLSRADHDVLVLADSDIAVPSGWLASLAAFLNEPKVGAASCFYVGHGLGGWSRLAAMGISYQFLPNALLGAGTGLAHPCFGATIALRRRTLEEIGGFWAFRDCLADDYDIGRAVRRRGGRLAYPPLLVSHRCAERSFRELWRHELRWARTVRSIDPLGHWGSLLTHALPLGVLAAIFLGFSPAGLAGLATVAVARLFLKVRIDHIAGTAAGPAWLLPVRDLLSFAVFIASLFGGAVEWKGQRLLIGRNGAISEG